MRRSVWLGLLTACAFAEAAGGDEEPGSRCPGAASPATTGKPMVLVDQAPTYRRLLDVDPLYPEAAKERCISGWVALHFAIEGGAARDVTVASAYPPGVFETAALSAVERWLYAGSGSDPVPRGTCAIFYFHHPGHPLEREAVAQLAPVTCPYPLPSIPRGPLQIEPDPYPIPK